MVEAIVSFGVEKLWDQLSQEYEQFQGVEDQVTELKSNLNLLKSFLKDADAKKHTNKMVRHCVDEIKEIVYDAEDIIETCILKEKVGKKTGIMKRIRRFARTTVDHREIASNIGGITKRISKVIEDMKSFGVQQIITDGSRSSHPLRKRQKEMRQTFSREYESDFVGLESNVKKLVGYLVEKDDTQIVSVTGMGGLGKTTLARQVFNHDVVKDQFDGFAWVCVSQDFTRISVWQTILQNLKPKEEEKKILEMTESKLQDELFRLLETSKSLIVFDDIWREEDWDLIKPIFPPRKGWKVLLTSRNESVAMRGDMTYINFKPKCLTIQDSWTLFQRIVMPRKDASKFKIDEEMEEMGKQMTKHCGGLPLAIKVLGGFLAAKYTLHDWKRLSENIGSHLLGGRTDFNYVLSLSFEELPSYLKHCFLFLAHFPEDHKINVEKLSYYWAAEGIYEPRQYDGETIRDVGDSYIEELVRRNMVISEREATTLRFETCHLHDMMREVCLFKAKEENFLQITTSRPPTANFQSHVTYRRFVLHNPTTLHVERDINNPKLRSLVVVQVNEPKRWKLSGSSYARLELLRVLDLFRPVFEGGKIPSGIGKLIHLRYLSLKGAKVSHLPSSLGNLLSLIYLNLDLKTLISIFVPNVLMGMQELRYLALPKHMHKKTKLELGNLEKLETLLHFSTENSNVRDIDRMTKLRTLSIYTRGEGCANETVSSSLTELRRLEYLIISLQACWLVEDLMPILEKLFQLKELELEYQSFSGRKMVCSGGGFPRLQKLKLTGLEEWEEWIVEEGSMPLLHTLTIWNCRKLKKLPNGFPQLHTLDLGGLEKWEEWIVEEGSMPLLHTLNIWNCPKLKVLPNGSMPLLHTLDIWNCPKLKKLPAGGFPRLQKLYLKGLEEWEEWIIEEGSMPLLHTLEIRHCEKLKKLPDGLSLIYSLKDLRIDKEWKERLSKGGEDYYKVKHIPSVKFKEE